MRIRTQKLSTKYCDVWIVEKSGKVYASDMEPKLLIKARGLNYLWNYLEENANKYIDWNQAIESESQILKRHAKLTAWGNAECLRGILPGGKDQPK